jgi:hypothetical protein
MLIANKYEVPDHCPETCSLKSKAFDQGDICCRCPVFSCEKFPVREEDRKYYGDYIQMLPPENYREDWAEVWAEWFDAGMPKDNRPKLYF